MPPIINYVELEVVHYDSEIINTFIQKNWEDYMKENKQLRQQLFLNSKKWLVIASITVTILSIYNIIISWLLQKIIDIAAGTDATSFRDVLMIAIISFAIFMLAYVFYRTAKPRFIQSAMLQYNGNALSGGEKQRISIARALLRKTSVLFMDEATAALDEITANEILSSILAIKDLTCIVVTHRLDQNILKQYDKIVVLHNGKVEECDTFENLLKKKGLFHSLYTISQCE